MIEAARLRGCVTTLEDLATEYKVKRVDLIRRALVRSGWRLGAAADLLGTYRERLRYLIGLDPELAAEWEAKRLRGRPPI